MGITINGSGTISSSTGSVSFDDDNITTSGTIPAAQLTGTMPAVNGASITNINASNIAKPLKKNVPSHTIQYVNAAL